MTEIEKLKKLKKLYTILLKLVDMYARPVYGYYNGGVWYNDIKNIIKKIDDCLIRKKDSNETIVRISKENYFLYRDYVGLNLIIKDSYINGYFRKA